MVEASTELLGGAAVTVFLALLFFGVVVLWDVALALRSVGDKIDKLEDNIDDDLTDIAHSLDGMSNGPGGGGGTQLHLSGGTISSGPGSTQAQQPQQSQQAAAGPQRATASETGPHPQSQTQHHEQGAQTARREPERNEAPTTDEAVDPETTGSTGPDDVETDDEPAEPTDTAPETEESADDGTEADEGAAELGDETTSTQPLADRNRGRFITSPDRTAWYATPLDRDAIAATRPSIAGALPDGSETKIDESEVIAAGPADSSKSFDPTAGDEDDAASAAPDADDTGGDVSESASDGAETSDDDRTDDDSVAEATAESKSTSETVPDATGERGSSTDDPDPSAGELTASTADEGNETADDSDAEPAPDDGDGTADDDAAIPESADDIDVLSFDEGTDGDAADVPDIADDSTDSEPPATGSSESDAVAEAEPGAPASADADADGNGEPDADADETPSADPLAGFEFDAEDEDVTVEEAVDTMNEDAPAPELSSHRFDVTAEEIDGDGAIVTLAFDTDTVDITGSTKRLLQYQMQSFADRESTPDGDVTIGSDRIVIEIPDSDGVAVQQWGEAAVSIVDRTLYLSDNSS